MKPIGLGRRISQRFFQKSQLESLWGRIDSVRNFPENSAHFLLDIPYMIWNRPPIKGRLTSIVDFHVQYPSSPKKPKKLHRQLETYRERKSQLLTGTKLNQESTPIVWNTPWSLLRLWPLELQLLTTTSMVQHNQPIIQTKIKKPIKDINHHTMN